MVNTQKRSRLMRLSWDIQRNRHSTRSKALQAAWAIVNNEEITLWYLTRRLNHFKPVKDRAFNQYQLFG